MFKVNKKDTRTKRLQALFWCLYCLLWTYFTPCSSVSIVNFEQVNAGWGKTFRRHPGKKICQLSIQNINKQANKKHYIHIDLLTFPALKHYTHIDLLTFPGKLYFAFTFNSSCCGCGWDCAGWLTDCLGALEKRNIIQMCKMKLCR